MSCNLIEICTDFL